LRARIDAAEEDAVIDTRDPENSPNLRSFHTVDLDEARELTCRTFAEHDVRVAGATDLDFRLDLAQSNRLTVGRMSYGAETTVNGPPMQRCYHLNLPAAGRSTVAQRGARRTIAGGEAGVVFSPDAPLMVQLSQDSWQYHVKLPKDVLETHAAKLTGSPTHPPIDFALTFGLRMGAGRALIETVGFLYEQLTRPGGLGSVPSVCRELESAVMTHLLLTVPNQLTRASNAGPAQPRRSSIQHVIDEIDDQPHRGWTSTDLAVHAGMSPRALQAGFHEIVGMSPTAYLRGVRLERARDDLLAGAMVTDVAVRWGFFHLGRFAQHFRQRFGELPSDTSRRGRGVRAPG
jgi:AraC-like DNA-binding protein